jgi:peptidoglycan/LPS O-acetylase OafA/YrhL
MDRNKSLILASKRIQVLRGISVLLVLLFHLNPNTFWYGYLGVDIFFGISGYLLIPRMLKIFDQKHKTNQFLVFFRRRLQRLLPPFYVLLSIFIPIIFLLGYPAQHETIFKLSLSGLLGMGNFGAYIYSGDYFEPKINPMLHIWSLSAEEQCYFLTPIIFMIILFVRKKMALEKLPQYCCFVLLGFQIITILTPNLYEALGIFNGKVFSYYSPLPRLIEFCIGGIASTVSFRKSIKYDLVIFLGMLTLIRLENSPTNIGLLVCYFICNVFIRNLGVFNKLNFHRLSEPLSWVGDRSYSVYLYHLPAIYISQIYFSGFLYYLISIIATLFLGTFSYKYVEMRFGLLKDYPTRNNSQKLLVFIVITILLCLVIENKNYFGKVERFLYINYDGTSKEHKNSFMNLRCKSLSPCEFYTKSDKSFDIILIGDSRAEMYSRVIYELAEMNNLNLLIWTSPGCRLFFDGFAREDQFGECLTRNTRLLNYLEKSRPSKIVISQAVYVSSNLKKMKEALSTLTSISSEIFLIQEIPIYRDVETFLVAKPILYSKPVNSKFVPERELNNLNHEAQKHLYDYAKTLDIELINPWPIFCEDKVCTRYENGRWLYSDTGHLSSEGANKTRELLRSVIFSEID